MGKKLSNLLLLVAATTIVLHAGASMADGGKAVIYFQCEKNNFLKVRGFSLFDIDPVVNKRTLDLDNLQPGQEKQSCELSPSYKVTLVISHDPAHSRDDEAVLIVDGNQVGLLPFDDPEIGYSYLFTTSKDGSIHVEHSETKECPVTKATVRKSDAK